MSISLSHQSKKIANTKTAANQWLNFMACAVAIFFVWLDSTCMPTMIPTLAETWPGEEPTKLAWVLNAYSITFALLLVPMGWITDRIGAWRMLNLGLIAFALTSLSCAMAPSLELLIFFRVLQGVAAACLTPAALVWALKRLPSETHSRAMYLWAAVGGIAAAAGPVFSNLAHETTWRSVFYVFLIASMLAWSALHFLHTDEALETETVLLTPAETIKPLRQTRFWLLQLSTLAFGFAFVMILLSIQKMFILQFRFTHQQAAVYLTTAITFCVITSFALAFSAWGKKNKQMIMLGCGLCAFSGWLLIGVANAESNALLVVALLLAGAGLGMALPNFPSISIHMMPSQLRGVANAVNQSSRILGSAIGIALAQWLQNPTLCIGPLLTLSCLLSALTLAITTDAL